MPLNCDPKRERTMKNASFIAVALVLIALPLVPAKAQVDLSKVLIGKWEGEVLIGKTGKTGNPTLIIKKVREEDGRWICKAKWGRPEKRLRQVDVTLQVNGGDVSIRFVTPRGAQVDVKLYKERSLVGTFIHPRGWESRIHLRKVE